MATLLDIAILFLIIAAVAYLLGARKVAGLSTSTAKILVVGFAVLFVATLAFGTLVNV